MPFNNVVAVLLIVCAVFTQTAFSEESHRSSVILAADMPDIFDTEIGKYAELKTLLENQKRQDYQASFFIFGGGSLGPSAMASFDKGAHIIDILNTLEPDVMGITKREFSYFTDELSLRAYESAFPMVSSNIIDSRNGRIPDGLSKYQLIEKNGLALGFISIVNARLTQEYLIDDVAVTEPIAAVERAAAELRRLGADIVLLHYSFPFEFVPSLLDTKVIDIAFLSDTRLQEHYRESVTQHPRIMFLDKPGQALLLEFSYQAGISDLSARAISLSQSPPNATTLDLISSYQERLKLVLNERLGVWSHKYSTRREDVRLRENAFANFVVDAMKDFADTDVALINGGGIRGDKQYYAGATILQRDIASELPFRSRIKVLSVKGQDLLDALEAGFSQVLEIKGGFPHVAGMQVKYNSAAPAGRKIISLSINGEQVDPNAEYSLATTDYLAHGGDGYTSLLKGHAINTLMVSNTILIADLVAQAITETGTLNSQLEGRIIDVSENLHEGEQ